MTEYSEYWQLDKYGWDGDLPTADVLGGFDSLREAQKAVPEGLTWTFDGYWGALTAKDGDTDYVVYHVKIPLLEKKHD